MSDSNTQHIKMLSDYHRLANSYIEANDSQASMAISLLGIFTLLLEKEQRDHQYAALVSLAIAARSFFSEPSDTAFQLCVEAISHLELLE